MNWTVGSGVIEQEFRDQVVKPHFEPGDAIFFDHLLAHRTAHGPGQKSERCALESWFFAASRVQDNPMLLL